MNKIIVIVIILIFGGFGMFLASKRVAPEKTNAPMQTYRDETYQYAYSDKWNFIPLPKGGFTTGYKENSKINFSLTKNVTKTPTDCVEIASNETVLIDKRPYVKTTYTGTAGCNNSDERSVWIALPGNDYIIMTFNKSVEKEANTLLSQNLTAFKIK